MDEKEKLRDEAIADANQNENHGESPIKGLVLNRLETIIRESDLEPDSRILELARRAYLRGVVDREITLRDLLEPLTK
jgi:hypothetical protein